MQKCKKLMLTIMTTVTVMLGFFCVLKTTAQANTAQQLSVVKLAKQQLNKPYVWGATGPNSFDCSGLVQYVYKHAINVQLPRTSQQQARVGTSVSLSALQPGDLLFFENNGHVGIYIGNNQFIDAPQPGQKVRISTINDYFPPQSARRLITPEPSYPMSAINMDVATVKYVPGYGILGFRSDGTSIAGSNTIFKDGTAWKVGAQRMINNEPMLLVGSDEWIPRRYTNIDCSTITINYTDNYSVNVLNSDGQWEGHRLKTGTQWNCSGFIVKNRQRLYKVATNEYIPEQYTQFGNGK